MGQRRGANETVAVLSGNSFRFYAWTWNLSPSGSRLRRQRATVLVDLKVPAVPVAADDPELGVDEVLLRKVGEQPVTEQVGVELDQGLYPPAGYVTPASGRGFRQCGEPKLIQPTLCFF